MVNQMKSSQFNRIMGWLFPVVAAAVATFVLFLPPRPGVADQGDFQRIMDITGLQETESTLSNPETLFYQYVKTKYDMTPMNPLRFIGITPSSSMIYPIGLAKAFCRIAGSTHFHTGILTAIYSALYIAALWLGLKGMSIQRSPVFAFTMILTLVIMLDGNYLVWFNSLYGEPMMILGLLLFTASALYAIKVEPPGLKGFIPLFVSSFLFLGSKTQCITALPFIVWMLVRIGRKNLRLRLLSLKMVLPVMLLLFYVSGIYWQQNKTCGVDTKFNAVFYGILKNSEDPQKDLEALGLSGDLAVEAGKHAYLPHSEYVRYVPWSTLTQKEFNEKINNLKLIRFYLMNPRRLITGMEYTASQCFQTATFLGKYEKDDVAQYTYSFNRFTFWSDYRSNALPKKLWLFVLVYLAAFIVSAIEYRRRAEDKTLRLKIELFWVILAIGIFQFPMPFVGNGEADTAKQLFLFNFTFDILVIVACTWVFSRLFFHNVEG